MKGKVVLVGAGPGDKGLLTIKGLKKIKEADAVVYDRLVGEDILKLIPDRAEKIDAGKKASNHTMTQGEINKILLEKALLGKNVVRLKGGDCFLFGRGAEELALIEKNGIDFEVVPGVSSALAVPAYGGIPVTNRDFSSSIHIFTAHKKNNEPLDIDFKSCVKLKGTLVFLMGAGNIKEIVKGLISEGISKDMPCAVIEKGSLSSQKSIYGNISNIIEIFEKENIKGPAVIVMGEVCTFKDRFNWFERLPLKGISVVVTRPADRNEKLSEGFKELGARVIESPLIKTESLVKDGFIEELEKKIRENDFIVFTSPKGVEYVFKALYEKRLDGRIFSGKKIAVIGSATGDELKKYGLFYDIMPCVYDGKNLGKAIAKKAHLKKVLLLRAKVGSEELTEELLNAGIQFDDTAVYYTDYVDFDEKVKKEILEGGVDYVTFTSPSTVKAFAASLKTGFDKFIGVCIGETTKKEAQKYGIKTIKSRRAVIEDMISAVVSEVNR